jgi:hypothetical protein
MLPHIVSTFKRFCNKEIGNNIFQRGYIEHIIRDREDYETRAKYIYENPMHWYFLKKGFSSSSFSKTFEKNVLVLKLS